MVDKFGNDEADIEADLRRRQQSEEVMDVRRALVNARSFWYTIMLQLHRFMIAVSRRTTERYCSQTGSVGRWGRAKQRNVAVRVNVDLTALPQPLLVFLMGLGFRWMGSDLCC